MTGFGRASAESDGLAIGWELRSVNGKGLEFRLRMPPGYERLEQLARQLVQKRFSRGNIQASLTLTRETGAAQPVVNEAFLIEVAKIAKRLETEFGAATARADGLLGLRGVIDTSDIADDPERREALDLVILDTLDKALASLQQARREEGNAIGAVLARQVDAIADLTKRAEGDPSRGVDAIRRRLDEQVRLLVDGAASLDEDRLHQEAAFLATKADIREEIDRLDTHVTSARSLLRSDGPVGRKLDFLGQEFNREANTLCSKSNSGSITAIGLELKSVVDQFREQVQNVE